MDRREGRVVSEALLAQSCWRPSSSRALQDLSWEVADARLPSYANLEPPTPAFTPQTGLFRGILAKANRKSLRMRHATRVLPCRTLSQGVLAPKGPWNPTVT